MTAENFDCTETEKRPDGEFRNFNEGHDFDVNIEFVRAEFFDVLKLDELLVISCHVNKLVAIVLRQRIVMQNVHSN